jgi:hypothetical protein
MTSSRVVVGVDFDGVVVHGIGGPEAQHGAGREQLLVNDLPSMSAHREELRGGVAQRVVFRMRG